MRTGSRREYRRRRQARRRLEGLGKAARAGSRGALWSAIFFLLLASLAGVAVMLVAGWPSYAVLFLPSCVLSGLALRKWERG